MCTTLSPSRQNCGKIRFQSWSIRQDAGKLFSTGKPLMEWLCLVPGWCEPGLPSWHIDGMPSYHHTGMTSPPAAWAWWNLGSLGRVGAPGGHLSDVMVEVSPGDLQLTLICGRLRSVAGWTVNGSLHQLKAPVLGAKNRTGRGKNHLERD